MLLASTGLLFAVLVAFSMPIVFALGAAAILGLVLGGYSLEMLASSLIGASRNDRRRRHRAVPAADGGGLADGVALRRGIGG
jgi:hypothetical protein